MTQVPKPTALFFGFLAAAMTHASAQSGPIAGRTGVEHRVVAETVMTDETGTRERSDVRAQRDADALDSSSDG